MPSFFRSWFGTKKKPVGYKEKYKITLKDDGTKREELVGEDEEYTDFRKIMKSEIGKKYLKKNDSTSEPETRISLGENYESYIPEGTLARGLKKRSKTRKINKKKNKTHKNHKKSKKGNKKSKTYKRKHH